jgi:shikimate kinase
VVLVGMMGAGKSTVGRRLAARLDRPFVDADDELVRRSGRTVRDWFAQEGESAFRAAEGELLADLLAAPGPSVVASGGGVVLAAANRVVLRDHALVVWLRAGAPFLASRVRQKPHRPLLDDDPEATIARLVAERSALYDEVADLVVDVDPFHADGDKPKRRLAEHIEALVRAEEDRGGPAGAEAGSVPTGSARSMGSAGSAS